MTTDIDGDGVAGDMDDRQAEWRRQDQEDQARMWGAAASAIVALWFWLREAPGRAWRFFRRVRIVARVHVVADSVGDAQGLYDRLFPFPPTDPGHESYRRSFVALALERTKSRQQWLLFAEMLDGLQAFEDRPLDAWLVLRRAPRPALTAPRAAVETASMPAIQGFVSAPVPGLNWMSMGLAVALVLTLGWGLWMRGDAMKAGRLRDALETERVANAGLGKRVITAEIRAEQTEATLKDFESRVEAMAKKDAATAGELAAIRRREKERAHAVRNGGAVSDAELLRELAEPAASIDPPVPAGADAAAAAGVQREVPGTPGGNAAQPDAGSQR